VPALDHAIEAEETIRRDGLVVDAEAVVAVLPVSRHTSGDESDGDGPSSQLAVSLWAD
jgi:hypothetical protein